MRKFLRDNGLVLFFGAIFLLALVGQAFAGLPRLQRRAGRRRRRAGVAGRLPHLVRLRRRRRGELAVGVPAVLPLHLRDRLAGPARLAGVQAARTRPARESDEEQQVGAARRPTTRRRGPQRAAAGARACTRARCGLVMGVIFLLLVARAVGRRATPPTTSEQLGNCQDPVSWADYLAAADFWNRTLQNWQSEFLAVGSMAVLSIYLRQRGSPESKPVGARTRRPASRAERRVFRVAADEFRAPAPSTRHDSIRHRSPDHRQRHRRGDVHRRRPGRRPRLLHREARFRGARRLAVRRARRAPLAGGRPSRLAGPPRAQPADGRRAARRERDRRGDAGRPGRAQAVERAAASTSTRSRCGPGPPLLFMLRGPDGNHIAVVEVPPAEAGRAAAAGPAAAAALTRGAAMSVLTSGRLSSVRTWPAGTPPRPCGGRARSASGSRVLVVHLESPHIGSRLLDY